MIILRQSNYGKTARIAGGAGMIASSFLKSPSPKAKMVLPKVANIRIAQPKAPDINRTTNYSIELWNRNHPKLDPSLSKDRISGHVDRYVRKKGRKIYRKADSYNEQVARFDPGDALTDFIPQNPAAKKAGLFGKIKKYIPSTAPKTLISDSAEVAKLQGGGNFKDFKRYVENTPSHQRIPPRGYKESIPGTASKRHENRIRGTLGLRRRRK